MKNQTTRLLNEIEKLGGKADDWDRNLITGEWFKAMEPGAYLANNSTPPRSKR